MGQIMRMKGLGAVILATLAGCDQVQEVMDNQPQPDVMLGAGIEVQIDDIPDTWKRTIANALCFFG